MPNQLIETQKCSAKNKFLDAIFTCALKRSQEYHLPKCRSIMKELLKEENADKQTETAIKTYKNKRKYDDD